MCGTAAVARLFSTAPGWKRSVAMDHTEVDRSCAFICCTRASMAADSDRNTRRFLWLMVAKAHTTCARSCRIF